MTITVSIGDFRQNLSGYLVQVSKGHNIMIKDDKKGRNIAELNPVQNWDPTAYRAMLKRRLAHPISIKEHPEWATRAKVEKWLRRTRMADERKFNVHP